MSVPKNFKNSDDYVQCCIQFLQTYQWLYNYSNTQVLIKDVFSEFPSDWMVYFKDFTNNELNQLMTGRAEEEKCPESLIKFFQTIQELTPNDAVNEFPNSPYTFKHNSGLNKKKLHEVERLMACIHEVCEEYGMDFIIDVGAGHGYLSHSLNEWHDYRVLGVECSKERVNQALKIQQKYYPKSKNQIVFIEHFIDQNSSPFILNALKENFAKQNFTNTCIVGLHACADLSVTILKMFMEMDFCKGLVIMPCCYHRLKSSRVDGEVETFENFPISNKFKGFFEQFQAEHFLRTPFLRLACQQTSGNFGCMTEEEHRMHSRSFMYRAILEDVVVGGKWQVHRLKRKSPKSTVLDADRDFLIYLENLKSTHKLTDQNGVELDGDVYEKIFVSQMHEKWNQHKGNCLLMEILTGLQASLQNVCENFVLLDRVEFLRESGFQCTVRKVTNDLMSPRCYALIVVKSTQ